MRRQVYRTRRTAMPSRTQLPRSGVLQPLTKHYSLLRYCSVYASTLPAGLHQQGVCVWCCLVSSGCAVQLKIVLKLHTCDSTHHKYFTPFSFSALDILQPSIHIMCLPGAIHCWPLDLSDPMHLSRRYAGAGCTRFQWCFLLLPPEARHAA